MNQVITNSASRTSLTEAAAPKITTRRFAKSLPARISMLGAALLTVAASFGAASASADAATLSWVKVSATGAWLAGHGVTNVVHFGHGRYDLSLSSNITNCAWTGTVNTSSGGDPGPGSASIIVSAANATTLFVRTATPSATPGSSATVDDDRPFSVLVTCP